MTDTTAATADRPRARAQRAGARRSPRGHELSASAAAAAGHALSAARHHRHRAAVPVLLDGADRDQAGRAAARPGQVQSVLDHGADAQAHLQAAVRDATIRCGCGTRCTSPSARPCCRSSPACSRPTRSCGCAIAGAQWVGGAIFLAYLVPPSILFIPLATVVFQYGLFDTPFALILTYPTILIPFSTWLLMGYFKTIPFELEECALIDGASRWQILTKIVLPLAIPGLISAFIFCFTLCWNEFIYALTFMHIGAEQDGAGRDRQRIRRRRHLSLGLADGGRAGGLAAAGDPVRVLRRALRVGDDRRRQGVSLQARDRSSVTRFPGADRFHFA